MTQKIYQNDIIHKLHNNSEEIKSLKNKISILENTNNYYQNKILDLQRINKDLLEKEIKNSKLSEEKKDREKRIENLEEEILNITSIDKGKKRQREKELEDEVIFYRGLHESGIAKIDAAENIIKLNNAQNKYIIDLEDELEKLRSHSDVTICKLKIEHDIHFYNLKKKMMNYIKDIQKNMIKNNNENLELNTKLGMLFKNQMLNELEHQAALIKELLKIKEKYEKIIFVLNQDIDLHKKVEKTVLTKNKKYVNIIKDIDGKKINSEGNIIFDDIDIKKDKKCFSVGKSKKKNKMKYKLHCEENDRSLEVNEAQLSIVKSIINNNIYRECNTSKNYSLDKINKKYYYEYITLKKSYDELYKENQNIKEQLTTMKDKQKMFNNKYSGIIKIYKNALDELLLDEELKNKNIQINKEIINKGNYESFSKEQKYIILMHLVDHLLPLIDKNYVDNDIELLKDLFQNFKHKKKSTISTKKEETSSRNNTISQLSQLNFRSVLDQKNNICDSYSNNFFDKPKNLKSINKNNKGHSLSINNNNEDLNSINYGKLKEGLNNRNKCIKLFKCVKSRDRPLRFIYIKNQFNKEYNIKDPIDTCLTKNNFFS